LQLAFIQQFDHAFMSPSNPYLSNYLASIQAFYDKRLFFIDDTAISLKKKA